jgi:hypothetical protein
MGMYIWVPFHDMLIWSSNFRKPLMRHPLAEADADVWAISAPRDLILPFSSLS